MASVQSAPTPEPIDEFRRVRSASIELDTIADMINDKGRAAGEKDDDELAQLVADIRHSARASQLSDHGELLEGFRAHEGD